MVTNVMVDIFDAVVDGSNHDFVFCCQDLHWQHGCSSSSQWLWAIKEWLKQKQHCCAVFSFSNQKVESKSQGCRTFWQIKVLWVNIPHDWQKLTKIAPSWFHKCKGDMLLFSQLCRPQSHPFAQENNTIVSSKAVRRQKHQSLMTTHKTETHTAQIRTSRMETAWKTKHWTAHSKVGSGSSLPCNSSGSVSSLQGRT